MLCQRRVLLGLRGLSKISQLSGRRQSENVRVESLGRFDTIREGCNVFKENRNRMDEQQVLSGFRHAVSLALAGVRNSPHVLSAGTLGDDLIRFAGILAEPGISIEVHCLLVEGLSRLEISPAKLLSKDQKFSTVLPILKHCVDRKVTSVALVESVMLWYSFGVLADLSNEQVLELLPWLSKLASKDVRMTIAEKMVDLINVRFYPCPEHLPHLPILAEFAASFHVYHANVRLALDHQELLIAHPEILARLVQYVTHLPDHLVDVLVRHLESAPGQFSNDSLVNAMVAVQGRLNIDARFSCSELLLAKCSELTKKQLLRLLSYMWKLGVREEHLLTCVSYLCKFTQECSVGELHFIMKFLHSTKLDALEIVFLAEEEVIDRLSYESLEQQNFLALLQQLHQWDSRLQRPAGYRTRDHVLTSLIAPGPTRPAWVLNVLATCLTSEEGLVERIFGGVARELSYLPTSFLLQVCDGASKQDSGSAALPLAQELVARVDGFKSLLDMVDRLSHLLPLSDSSWKQAVERLTAMVTSNLEECDKVSNKYLDALREKAPLLFSAESDSV